MTHDIFGKPRPQKSAEGRGERSSLSWLSILAGKPEEAIRPAIAVTDKKVLLHKEKRCCDSATD